MSTLALWSAGAAPAVEAKEAKPSLFQRFVKAREAEAARRVYNFLATHDAARLKELGFTPEDIADLRQGRFPVH